MSSLRAGDRVLLAWALAVALLLHLPAHVGWSGGLAGREALYEDGPALVSNRAFEPFGSEGFADVVTRAVRDPSAAWDAGDGSVGRSRWRPVATAALAVQRWVFGTRAAQGAAAVSLALHLAVVALTLGLLRRLDAPRAARWIGGTVVAAGPAALAAAAWPAHQPVVLATALGLAAVVTGLRPGARAGLVSGVLFAAAGLSHELAFGLPLALVALRRRSAATADRAGGFPWTASIVATAAAVTWSAVVPGLGPAGASLQRPPMDGLVGVLHAAVSMLVPARLHFADGPWTATVLGHAAAVLLAVAAAAAWRRGASEPSRLAGAACLALSPLLLLGLRTAPAGAPFHDGALYLAAPLGAGAVAWAIAGALARGGGLRIAAAVAGALWVGANVGATATRSASFRTRPAHVALAVLEMPDSPVVEAWSLDSAAADAKRAGAASAAGVRALASRAEDLGRRMRGDAAELWRRDPVAAATIAASLSQFARTLLEAGVAPGDPVWESAEVGAAAATELVPGWTHAWLVLATTRDRAGALRAAFDASARAAALSPENPEVLATGTQIALALGDARFASAIAETLLAREKEDARAQGRALRPEVLLLYARAAAADGVTRIEDPFGETGVRFRYEVAIAVLEDLVERGELADAARREAYSAFVAFGDVLASLDRTALALIAYRKAIATGVKDVTDATEHHRWLLERLHKEEAAARAAVERAARGEGNVADAMVALAIAFARQARWDDADQVFAQLEQSLGMPPVLRFHRAVHLLREREPRRAIEELRQVVREDAALARAHYELARLEEEDGQIDRAVESYREARRLAVDQAGAAGADEWLLDADDRFEALDALLREAREPR